MTHVMILIGAVTPPGRLHAALSAAAEQSATTARVATLREFNLGFADGRPVEERDDDAAALLDTIASAGGILVATPVYHGWLPGALKNALDLVPKDGLLGKPVALVVQGNDAAHANTTVEALRDIVTYLGATVRGEPVVLLDDAFVEGRARPGVVADLAAAIDRAGAE